MICIDCLFLLSKALVFKNKATRFAEALLLSFCLTLLLSLSAQGLLMVAAAKALLFF